MIVNSDRIFVILIGFSFSPLEESVFTGLFEF